MCTFCVKAADGAWDGLIELGVRAPQYPNSYLVQCPFCSQYWMGHGYEPQLMLDLSAADAAEAFPELEKKSPGA